MALETLTITDANDITIHDIARQRHMQEGADLLQTTETLQAAVRAGLNVTALREMNTNAILEVKVDGHPIVDRFADARRAEAA